MSFKGISVNKLINAAIAACVCFASQGVIASNQTEVVIGFDGLAEWATDVGEFGVTISGAAVLACGSSLNCGPFPPSSGKNVIYDHVDGKITALFSSEAGNISKVSARITGNTSIDMLAYDKDGLLIASASTGGANYVGSGTGIPANMLLTVSAEGKYINKILFSDHGNSFTVDDFSFTSDLRSIAIDPGHGLLWRNGEFVYQRAPSESLGVIEDQKVLQISKLLRNALAADGMKVVMTRSNEYAPFAPKDCGIPCLADTKKRAEWVDKQEVDVMLSVHSNGGVAAANGTETYYTSASEKPLAEHIHSALVSLIGLKDRKIKNQSVSNIMKADTSNSLVEVAFHTNTLLEPGHLMTDEELLYESADLLADAIAAGLFSYHDSK